MSKTLIFYPKEATQEITQKIKSNASTPAANFASTVPTSRNKSNGKNATVHTRGTKPFHNKRPP